MGRSKKSSRHQPPPLRPAEEDSAASTDEDSVVGSGNQPTAHSCPHLGRAVSLPALKKSLKTSWTRVGQCSPCAKDARAAIKEAGRAVATSSSAAASPHNLPSKEVWMCMRCGLQLCGGGDSQEHFAKHCAVPRSDSHCVGLNVTPSVEPSWQLRCQVCNQDVAVDSSKKVREAVDFVRKMAETKGTGAAAALNRATSNKSFGGAIGSKSMKATTDGDKCVVLKPRGLSNLGNTCFFNSVMQSLAKTFPLIQALEANSLPGSPLKICFTDKSDNPLPELKLGEAGAITLALCAFLKEMSMAKTGVINPGHLFGQVCRRSPQFRGFQQQDAHELLRHLLDGVRAEESRRRKQAVLRLFGLSEKTDPRTVEADMKKKLQAVGRYASYTLVDRVFGGHLVSTVVCEQCHHSSQMYEPFLDLSLPLIGEKPQRPSGKKGGTKANNEEDEVDVSCFGAKKKSGEKVLSKREKERLKREKKRNKKWHRKKGLGDKVEDAPDNAIESGEAVTLDNKDKYQEKVIDHGESAAEDVEGEVDDEESGEERKLQKDLEENEKENKSFVKNEDDFVCQQLDGNMTPIKITSTLTSPFEPKTKKEVKDKKKEVEDGNEEDDEGDDGYSEENDDWEWDYGEGNGLGEETYAEVEATCDNDESPNVSEHKTEKDTEVEKKPLVSLNPLPSERLGSSERERSSEAATTASECASSVHGDVEDNVDEMNKEEEKEEEKEEQAMRELETSMNNTFLADPDHLDPHMEELCRKVRRISVSSARAETRSERLSAFGSATTSDDQQKADDEAPSYNAEWLARSLSSLSPRYQSSAFECSVYSCLSQFTSPELMAGNNKWACDKCTELKRRGNHSDTTSENDSGTEHDGEKKGTKKKETKVYSNASRQLLIFSPPAVLTIHLKRFQQTLCGRLRKVSRHVQFPSQLDLGPFSASTSLCHSSVDGGPILYRLFAVVEHSGRLQGGHYTAFVNVRPTDDLAVQATGDRFHTAPSPVKKQDEMRDMLHTVEKKCQELAQRGKNGENVKDMESNHKQGDEGRWFCASDSQVTEVSLEKVLKSQAYLLLYERIQ